MRQVRQAIQKRSRTKSIQDRQSAAQTSKVHEEPIKLIIKVSHKTSSTSDCEAKTNEVDTRSTKRSKDERSIKEKPNHKKVKNDPGKWGIFFETESLVGPRLEVKGI